MKFTELIYSVIIEYTDEPDFFGFYSPDLEGFSGIGRSVKDCIHKARQGMKEHIELLREQKLPVPIRNPKAEIIIHHERELAAA
ncbi:MAG TPA: HicB family protein [Desulfobacteraceae bacterium]|nr:HicB family protein [Desulfobacteraceae bacterium]